MAESSYEMFTSHDGTSIAYRVSGQGLPVVLVHGFLFSSTSNFAMHFDRDATGGLIATGGPTVESALLAVGRQVVMLDLRGHGRSEKPADPGRYSMQTFANDVRALVDHLALDHVPLVGYSLGGMIASYLLADPWVSAAALCGVSSFLIEDEEPEFDSWRRTLAKCFLEGCWDEYPDFEPYRAAAELDPGANFVALGNVAAAIEGIPTAMLKSASIPVLVLNGGADDGVTDESDVARFIPGARRAVAGDGDHIGAPSDPLFQTELARFLSDTA